MAARHVTVPRASRDCNSAFSALGPAVSRWSRSASLPSSDQRSCLTCLSPAVVAGSEKYAAGAEPWTLYDPRNANRRLPVLRKWWTNADCLPQWSRLIGGSRSLSSRSPRTTSPAERLAAFKRTCNTLQVSLELHFYSCLSYCLTGSLAANLADE